MKRGEIWNVNLEPVRGREQQGQRPVMIITEAAFNAKFAPLVCPITGGGNAARFAGFAVSLSGAGLATDGIVLCHQLRVLDVKARGGRRVEQAPDFIVGEVLAAVQDLVA